MSVLRQTVMPVVKFIAHNNGNNKEQFKTYQVFSANSPDLSGKNLLSYNFQRSSYSFSGNFSITVKEDDYNVSNNGDSISFLDKLESLDIVEIREDVTTNHADFIGIILNVSIQANVTGKTITITGRSVEYILEFLTISLDVTAMAWAGEWLETNARNLQLKTAVNNGEKPPVVKDSIKEIYNSFKEVANQFSKISNAEVIGIFEKYCSPDFLEENKTVNDTFKYPITSNLYQNSVITLFNYLKNLFPDKVYEFYGIVENGKPKIRLREMPFLDNSKNIELLKTAKSINPISLMSYHLERSIEEVYTVFFAYVEGSAFSPDYYSRAEATRDGNYNAQKNEEKIRKYGYKPLQANFIGFNTEKAESVDVNNNLSKKLNVLNEQLKNAYENLDEMYTGTISVINILGEQKAEIGEYIKFLGGNFYVTDVTHSWQYSVGPRINYGIERGGFYNANGKFSKLTNITERLKELKK